MESIELLRHGIRLSEAFTLSLAEDLRDAPMARPCAGGNHATWIMGHLAHSDATMLAMVTGDASGVNEAWKALFDGGTQPVDDAGAYPAYGTLLDAFVASRQGLVDCVDGLDAAGLGRGLEGLPEPMVDVFGTVGKTLFACSVHPFHHRGQLADVRRSLGRGPVFV